MATLKSRQILAERQAQAQVSSKEYKDPNTWQKMIIQHRKAADKSVLQYVQNPLGIVGGVVANSLQKITTGEVLEGTKLEGLSLSSGTLSYTRLWRYKLLMKGDNGMEKTDWSPRPGLGTLITDALPFIKGKESEVDRLNKHTTKTLSDAEKSSKDVVKIISRRNQVEYTPVGIDYVKDKFISLAGFKTRRKNEVIIINASVSPYQAIVLQNRPNELNIDPKANWASVSSMGRNVPFMMYTGGEDTISFEISWYANDKSHRDEVIWKCKLLESWSRANGYQASPPLLNIKWGASDIFTENDYFVLESAQYILKDFQDQARPLGADNYDNLIDLKLNPIHATQSLVFKRVSMTNPTYEDIVPLGKLDGIKGITELTSLR